MQYAIKLANGYYVTYEQTGDLLLEIHDIILKYAETFNSYEEAESFALAINNRKDGDYNIHSYEDAVSIVEIDNNGEWLTEKDLELKTKSYSEYIIDVTKGGYVGHSGWEEPIYIATEKDEDYDDIFKKYVGKKVKLTIEVID